MQPLESSSLAGAATHWPLPHRKPVAQSTDETQAVAHMPTLLSQLYGEQLLALPSLSRTDRRSGEQVVPALGTHLFWMQVLPGSQWLNAPLTAVQVPLAPLVSQRSHEPLHAVLQQTPSTQNLEAQSGPRRHWVVAAT